MVCGKRVGEKVESLNIPQVLQNHEDPRQGLTDLKRGGEMQRSIWLKFSDPVSFSFWIAWIHFVCIDLPPLILQSSQVSE